MPSFTPYDIRLLGPRDVGLMEGMSTTFAEAFDQVETYSGARPSAAYLERLLGSDHFIALAAVKYEKLGTREDVLHFDISVMDVVQ